MQYGSTKPPSDEVSFETIYQGVSQAVTYTGTQGQSTALQKRTSVVRLVATSACFVQIGLTTDNSAAGPTAAAGTSMYIPAATPVMVGVPAGAGVSQIAVIQASASGTLYITEGA